MKVAWWKPVLALTALAVGAWARADVTGLIAEEVKWLGIPGLTVAVRTLSGCRYDKAFGYADLENEVPATTQTVYRLASVSKCQTAVGAMHLAEEGLLDLDRDVRDYCPAFPQKDWPVTSRQLLAHLGGIRHYEDNEPPFTRHFTSVADALVLFKDAPLQFKPGSRFLYTTYGYNLLGCAMEGAAARPFVDLLRAAVWETLGMKNTRDDNLFAIIPHRAQGYQRGEDGYLRNSAVADTSGKIPGGGLVSTAADLAEFGVGVLAGKVLKPESVKAMFTEQRTSDGKPTEYGLGWILPHAGKESPNAGAVWHTGHQERVSTVLYLLPSRGIVVAILSNLENPTLTSLAREVAENFRCQSP